jgi:glycosyltransferase involved in cell wall biosynthesis
MTVTVLVDAWHLGGPSANRGIGTYLRELLPRLAHEPDMKVVGLAAGEARLPTGVSRRPISRVAPGRFAQREHDARLSFDLARAARLTKADVVLSPADNPPRKSTRPWVQTLHDLIPLVVKDPSFDAAARRWRRIGRRLRAADVVIANSAATAADATGLLGVDPDRLRVIPLGVSPRFEPPVVRKRGAPHTILYVGEFGPHKGFADAFAIAGCIADRGLPHRLAMVGRLAPWYEPEVRELLARASHPERIDLLDYVADIVTTYQLADALVVTSRYEGFCLPALEAMACGTPVVAFDNSALRETVGNGGLLVPNGDVATMADELSGLLTDDVAWARASQRGIAHARRFSWERCARSHADVLREVATGVARS